MKNTLKICLLLSVLSLASCSTYKWKAPAFTNVEKLSKVEKGMNINQLNSTLGVQPYNIYNMQEDGATILVYNYRTRIRNVNVPKNSEKRIDYIFGNEAAQSEGKIWYEDGWHTAYVFLREGKVSSILTDAGREDAEKLQLVQNNIQEIASENVTDYRFEILDSAQHAEPVIFPSGDSSPQKGNSSFLNLNAEKKTSKVNTGKKVLYGVGSASLLLLLLLL